MLDGVSAVVKAKIIIIIEMVVFSSGVEPPFGLYSASTEIYILLIFASRLVLLFSCCWTFLIIFSLGI